MFCNIMVPVTIMLMAFLIYDVNSIESESLESIYEKNNANNNYTVLVIIEGDILKWLKCRCVNEKKCRPNNLVNLLR